MFSSAVTELFSAVTGVLRWYQWVWTIWVWEPSSTWNWGNQWSVIHWILGQGWAIIQWRNSSRHQLMDQPSSIYGILESARNGSKYASAILHENERKSQQKFFKISSNIFSYKDEIWHLLFLWHWAPSWPVFSAIITPRRSKNRVPPEARKPLYFTSITTSITHLISCVSLEIQIEVLLPYWAPKFESNLLGSHGGSILLLLPLNSVWERQLGHPSKEMTGRLLWAGYSQSVYPEEAGCMAWKHLVTGFLSLICCFQFVQREVFEFHI